MFILLKRAWWSVSPLRPYEKVNTWRVFCVPDWEGCAVIHLRAHRKVGGLGGIWTPDLLDASQAFIPLNYQPSNQRYPKPPFNPLLNGLQILQRTSIHHQTRDWNTVESDSYASRDALIQVPLQGDRRARATLFGTNNARSISDHTRARDLSVSIRYLFLKQKTLASD